MRLIITAVVMVIGCITIGIIEYKNTRENEKFKEEMKKFQENEYNKMLNNSKQ